MKRKVARTRASCAALPRLPSELQRHVLSFLPPNERALTGRHVCRDAADGLGGTESCAVCLSQPLPAHAAPWALAALQQRMRRVPFRDKLQLLCTAAASGSEVNLEVTMAALQPSIFPELLHSREYRHHAFPFGLGDPGMHAVRAGHPQLLAWLLRRCPALLQPAAVLWEAAGHGSLPVLQATWEVLQGGPARSAGMRVQCGQQVLDAAARSATPDAVFKMEWALAVGGPLCSLKESTAEAAARSGDLARLRWLRDRGCPMGGGEVLERALQHADLAVAQWLVEEAGCRLPSAGDVRHWLGLLEAAAGKGSEGAAANWQWLQARGAPPVGSNSDLLPDLAAHVIRSGQVELFQQLQRLLLDGNPRVREAVQVAIQYATPGSTAMAACLLAAGRVFTQQDYVQALGARDMAMLRWLARDARVSAAGLDMGECLTCLCAERPGDHRDLLEAVQLVVGAGCRMWDASAALHLATMWGSVELVEYFMQHPQQQGQPCYRPGADMVQAVATGGCEALHAWLEEQLGRRRLGRAQGAAYAMAAEKGDMCTLTALRRLGVPWDADVMLAAVLRGSTVPVLRWLLEQGAPRCSVEDVDRAEEEEEGCGFVCSEVKVWLRGLARA